ncbi:MAG TPA: DNA methyltransferase [Alphaproteobacteria bacterium]|nr:DNA methyltransferase [Alphaproteobacteria bacterium]
MTLSVPRVRHYLREFALEKLFIEELGWDRHSAALTVQVDGQAYTLNALAEKRGVQIFQCQPDARGNIPDYASRRKIETQVAKSAYEHLIIYIDAAKTMQIWQWVARQPGQPAAYREHHYHPQHQSGEALIQKLEAISFPLSEEEGLDLAGVVFRLRDAFDRDQVTKRFYDHFKREHAAFLDFITGITEQGDKEWYASLMLNRLMFVYFIQRKGFLDGDPDYLKNRLKQVQQRQGRGKFLTFYRYFLLRLFHEGFAQQPAQRAPDLEQLLGDVPYLNGGLFELHTLEEKHVGIDIPDEAFERLFAFFDQYEWHLDTRPLRNDREINPDVLGYIFEKYVNQKQMGAYYTKEDITGYIAKNTITPYLFDAAEKKCAIAFQPKSALWQLLRDDPDRYIYEPVRKGVDLPLPEEIARGIGDVSQRGGWNRPAAAEFALPTETWREHVARRQRCLELRDKLRAGEIHQINDLITYNLDIRQFAEDVITTCEGPELLRAFWHAIKSVTVLDPTCGSGAFLFAALNILEPLYEACLDRMQAFVDDLDRSGERHRLEKFRDFRRILAEVDRHPNRRYFILKSIIVNNLYGVDIMEEAVEICKLRLFLNLVAQVDRVKDLEPLPDIDFNIRPGNTLVGFVSLDEIRRAAERDAAGQGRLIYGEVEEAIQRIEEDAEIVERAFQKFHEMQSDLGMDARDFAAAKQELRRRLRMLVDELDRYLAGEYGINPDKATTYDQWRQSHQPFHWIAEFYGIIRKGGFDVIIGNPPYIELRVINDYQVRGYHCEEAGNLYALIIERCHHLDRDLGRQRFIVPVSSVSTDRYNSLQKILTCRELWYSSFDDRPSRLFDGLEHVRLTIHLIGHKRLESMLFSTRYNKWNAVERATLFSQIQYVPSHLGLISNSLPKLTSLLEMGILSKLIAQNCRLSLFYAKNGKHRIFYSRKVGYFLQVLDFEPKVLDGKGRQRPPSEFKELRFGVKTYSNLALCCLNSNLFYWFITVFSDCRHVNKREVDDFPIDLLSLSSGSLNRSLILYSNNLMTDLSVNSIERQMKFSHDTLTVQCIIPKLSKSIIDQIDSALAQHYGFTNEELDFIINYDIKYRMGQDGKNDEE